MNPPRLTGFPSLKKCVPFFFLALAFWAQAASGITPMEYYNSIVAGWDDPGFRDGAFSQALFNSPCGLAIDDAGERLFVADRDNHRIRVVYLGENNRVATLAGTGAPGKTDGKFPQATFNRPSIISYLPGDRLAVFDSGDALLRVIDLKKMEVSTLTGNTPETGLGNILSMCYFPKDDSLYLAEPGENRLRKLELKSRKLATVLSNHPQVPAPRALGAAGGRLYVADWNLPDIYQVEPSANTLDAAALTKVGSCNNVHALAGMDEKLYAVQEGTHALVRILPDNQQLGLPTAWGFFAENKDPGLEPLLSFNREGALSGFVVSPKEKRKLFLTCPDLAHSILSVKDYDFRNKMTGGGEFDYPAVKPPATFRILIVGDSRVGSAMLPATPEKLNEPNFSVIEWDRESTRRTNTFAKQLEFLLNAKAAVNGTGLHFEVLTLWMHGTSSGAIIIGPALDTVKYIDADLVIALAAPSTYQDYFGMPMTKDGIPGPMDAEYLLKPFGERIAPGVPRHFYELCKKKNLVKEEDGRLIWYTDPGKWESMDADVRKDLMELTARPFRAFQNWLQSLKKPGGGDKKLLMLFVPWRNSNTIGYERFWKDTCLDQQLNLLDLSEPFYAMKAGFYPVDQRGFTHHYLNTGNFLIAYLLSHYLTEQKWVPFEARDPKNTSTK
jgi:hypothetical protein